MLPQLAGYARQLHSSLQLRLTLPAFREARNAVRCCPAETVLHSILTGHETRHFNVGQYRRKQNDTSEVQDASFFDRNNPVRHPLQRRQQPVWDCCTGIVVGEGGAAV